MLYILNTVLKKSSTCLEAEFVNIKEKRDDFSRSAWEWDDSQVLEDYRKYNKLHTYLEHTRNNITRKE